MPELSRFDGAEEQKKELAQHEQYLRKIVARIRRNAATTGKAGRKPKPETLELYRTRFIKGKPWKVCFEELWSKPGRKPPVMHELTRVMRRLRERVKAYAASHASPGAATAA
jgi:hypothetical protein